jgi:hypothetical protein
MDRRVWPTSHVLRSPSGAPRQRRGGGAARSTSHPPALGSTKGSRVAYAETTGAGAPGSEHGKRHLRKVRPLSNSTGTPSRTAVHGPVSRRSRAEPALVHRLQGGLQDRRRKTLLSPDFDGCLLTDAAALHGFAVHEGRRRASDLRTRVPRPRSAREDPHRQWIAVRQSRRRRVVGTFADANCQCDTRIVHRPLSRSQSHWSAAEPGNLRV